MSTLVEGQTPLLAKLPLRQSLQKPPPVLTSNAHLTLGGDTSLISIVEESTMPTHQKSWGFFLFYLKDAYTSQAQFSPLGVLDEMVDLLGVYCTSYHHEKFHICLAPLVQEKPVSICRHFPSSLILTVPHVS